MTDKHRQFNGTWHCVKNILMHEGPLAFFKGFGMCWGRVSASSRNAFFSTLPLIALAHPSVAPRHQLGTHTIVSFLAFERLRQLFGIDPM